MICFFAVFPLVLQEIGNNSMNRAHRTYPVTKFHWKTREGSWCKGVSKWPGLKALLPPATSQLERTLLTVGLRYLKRVGKRKGGRLVD